MNLSFHPSSLILHPSTNRLNTEPFHPNIRNTEQRRNPGPHKITATRGEDIEVTISSRPHSFLFVFSNGFSFTIN